MELLLDILEEVLEEAFSLLIESRKIPKSIRYVLVTLVVGFIIALGFLVATPSRDWAGRIIGCALIIFGIVAGIFLVRKIHRN